jgi:RHS repeat-associated protein
MAPADGVYTRMLNTRQYELKDHLGNVRTVVTDQKLSLVTAGIPGAYEGKVVSASNYYPFGMDQPGRTWSAEGKYRYGFNGKEKDSNGEWGSTSYDYGFRIYNPGIGRFLRVDPKAEKFPYASPYNFVLNNPITNIDPDGAEVIIGFNKQTGKLAITDLDHYKKGLPIRVVSAKDYVHGGIRDDKGNLTHNQILVMENVFSGGRVEADGTITRDLDRDKYEVAIPNGSFDLTEYEGGRGWYKVDPIDESRYDDHHQGYTNADGETRNGYRFHLGGLSHGCITVCDPNGERQDEWNVVGKILENTSKTEVPKREGMQKYIPGTTRMKYGTINVTGTDRVKEVKKEE